MHKTVFITGNSSGLGRALSERALELGWSVYGLSRRGCYGLSGDLHDIQCDLAEHSKITPALETMLLNVKHIDCVFLNAGVLGEIRELSQTPVESITKVMDVNVWANKIILDWLFNNDVHVEQTVAISSGVAVNPYRGWGAYSLSKGLFKELIQLYAMDFPETHFVSLVPGLVDTAMQAYLRDESIVSVEDFPSVQKFRDARGTDKMQTPTDVAELILKLVPKLRDFTSGSFVDIRKL